MRVLITGGFGYVGGRVAQYLDHLGFRIVLGSRTHNTPPSWLPGAESVQTDWNDEDELEEMCRGVDIVLHAAGMEAKDCEANPEAALEFNGLATARLVSAACRGGVRRFLYLSTAHVYASPLVGTITEESCPRNLHPYATSHLAGELAVMSAGQRGPIEGVILRLSNAFGPPAHTKANCWMLLVNDLCRQSVLTRTIRLRSAGLQRRDFVTLYDVSRAIFHLIGRKKETLGDGVFNIGGMASTRVIDMARLIRTRCLAVLGFAPEITLSEIAATDEPFDLDFRVDKILNTGFQLIRNVDEEIDATLKICPDVFGAIQI